MTRGVPMIDPKVHLKGATPEKLARALLRNRNLDDQDRMSSSDEPDECQLLTGRRQVSDD